MTTWTEHARAWRMLPVDDVDYVSASYLLGLPDDELRGVVEKMRITRFTGWRNHRGLWRSVLGLDRTSGATVLDYGCGVGVEALDLALSGNVVDVADVNPESTELAQRVVKLFSTGFPPLRFDISGEWPFVTADPGSYDVFHCSGVLHHSRTPVDVMRRAWELLRPGGHARLMLYSDVGWWNATETCPPPRDELETHPRFGDFVRYFDQVGDYAEWYDLEKIVMMFGRWFTVDRFAYLTPWRNYLAVDLARRDEPLGPEEATGWTS